jgi:PIN domain nuclease of toxin-antitoxin system
MKLLVDTCALLALGTGNLPKEASKYEAAVPALVSWEIAIKIRTGKLQMNIPPHAWFQQTLERYQLGEILPNTRLLCAAAKLPLIHHDTFDRVLIATCLSQNLTILTSNRIIPTLSRRESHLVSQFPRPAHALLSSTAASLGIRCDLKQHLPALDGVFESMLGLMGGGF